jgi:hypothetical protein
MIISFIAAVECLVLPDLVMWGLGSLCQASVLGSNSTICGGMRWSIGKLGRGRVRVIIIIVIVKIIT